MFYKPEIRKRILNRRKQLNPTAILQASKQAAAQLLYLPYLIESRHIGHYLSYDGEIDPSLIIQFEILQNKTFYLPVISPDDDHILSFYPYKKGDTLVINKYGIKEPTSSSKNAIDLRQLDVVIAPVVSFDKNCNRIGHGAGYYDKTFAFKKESDQFQKPLLIGLAYEFQKVDYIEPSEWDVPMDLIVTEKDIYKHY